MLFKNEKNNQTKLPNNEIFRILNKNLRKREIEPIVKNINNLFFIKAF